MNPKQKFNFIYAMIAIFGILFLHELWVQQQTVAVVPYSELEQQLKQGKGKYGYSFCNRSAGCKIKHHASGNS